MTDFNNGSAVQGTSVEQNKSEYKNNWKVGTFNDEWIFAYSSDMQLLLMDYPQSNDSIYEQLIKDETDEGFSSKAAKVVRNIKYKDIVRAMSLLEDADAVYDTLHLDWRKVKDFKYELKYC